MKKHIFIVFFSFLALVVNAQSKTYDTIPYALEHHRNRVALFKQEPMVKGKIIFLGNSITEFGDWKGLLKDQTVINRGIAGDITFGVLNRLEEVIAHAPSKLFIKIGINDISKNIPDAVIVENIFTIVKRIKAGSPKTQIFIHSILPTNDAVKENYPDAFNKNEHVVTVNSQLKRNAKRIGFTFVDLYSKFRDKTGKLDVRYANDDGLHLNPQGYQLWVELLQKWNCLGVLPEQK